MFFVVLADTENFDGSGIGADLIPATGRASFALSAACTSSSAPAAFAPVVNADLTVVAGTALQRI
jgi:hypothetical protein